MTTGVAAGLGRWTTDIGLRIDADLAAGTADVVAGAVDRAADTIAATLSGCATHARTSAFVGAALVTDAGLITGAAGAATDLGGVAALIAYTCLPSSAADSSTCHARGAAGAVDATFARRAAGIPACPIAGAAIVASAPEAISATLGRTGSIAGAAFGVVDAGVAGSAAGVRVHTGTLIPAAPSWQAGFLGGAARVRVLANEI